MSSKTPRDVQTYYQRSEVTTAKPIKRTQITSGFVTSAEAYQRSYSRRYPHSALLCHKEISSFHSNSRYDCSKPFFSTDVCFNAWETSPRKEQVTYMLCPFCPAFKNKDMDTYQSAGELRRMEIRLSPSQVVQLEPEEPLFYKYESGDYAKHLRTCHNVTFNSCFEGSIETNKQYHVTTQRLMVNAVHKIGKKLENGKQLKKKVQERLVKDLERLKINEQAMDDIMMNDSELS